MCSTRDAHDACGAPYLKGRIICTVAVRVVTAYVRVRLRLISRGAVRIGVLEAVSEMLGWAGELMMVVSATAKRWPRRQFVRSVFSRMGRDESTERLKIRVVIEGTLVGVALWSYRGLLCLLLVGISLSRAGAPGRVGPSNLGFGHFDKGNEAYSRPSQIGATAKLGLRYY